jgi:hypothetical protein
MYVSDHRISLRLWPLIRKRLRAFVSVKDLLRSSSVRFHRYRVTIDEPIGLAFETYLFGRLQLRQRAVGLARRTGRGDE